MDKKYFQIGVRGTGGWLAFILIYVLASNKPILNLEPNEWGDFLAGVAAPLAVFWFILAFLQQGLELKQNTQALLLQQEELKRQADALLLQHKEMKLQVEASHRLYGFQEQQAWEKIQPKFVTAGRSGNPKGEMFYFKNEGNRAYDLSLKNHSSEILEIETKLQLDKDHTCHLIASLSDETEYPLKFEIHYEDEKRSPAFVFGEIVNLQTLRFSNPQRKDSPPEK